MSTIQVVVMVCAGHGLLVIGIRTREEIRARETQPTHARAAGIEPSLVTVLASGSLRSLYTGMALHGNVVKEVNLA
ncbi:protein of unknown function [Pararobbsia alpina]|uniref:hypothetical protein n=1 Tax=Pararobbsia alpina TaxID=621374 RepID=UPI0039A6AE74